MLTVFKTLLFVSLVLLISTTQAQRKPCKARVRKAWEEHTLTEQETYLRAVSIAMEKGYYAAFANVHAHKYSSDQAHKTCGFLLWHRRYLLAYENMLRSLGPDFKCVTVPVWNMFGEYALQQQQKCFSMEECSPLLRAMGGSHGVNRRFTFGPKVYDDNCVEQGVAGKFCQDFGINFASKCTKCIARGKWHKEFFPSGLSFNNLIEKMATNDAQELNIGLKGYIHNAIHSQLNSIMASFYAPVDPIFFSLHATFDLLQFIHYLCRVNHFLSDEEKKTNEIVWKTCGDGNDFEVPTANSDIIMQYNDGKRDRNVEDDPHIGIFFKDLPKKFYQYVDLGEFSYNYQATSLMTDLLFNPNNPLKCPSLERRRLETHNKSSPGAKAVAIAMAVSRERSDVAVTRKNQVILGANAKQIAEESDLMEEFIEVEHIKSSEIVEAEKKSLEWYYTALSLAATATATTTSEKEARVQAQIMECQLYETLVGPVQDFSEKFRQQMNLPPNRHLPCYELLHIQNRTTPNVTSWTTKALTILQVHPTKI
jgi:tyrosinase